MLNKVLKLFSQNKVIAFLVLLGALSWSLTMVKSGWNYKYGLGFWGPNGRDGVWHIALTESLAKGSFEMPIFTGESIKNYHIGFDLLLAVVHKLTQIPISNLYFQIIPPIIALLIGIAIYKFVYLWKKSRVQAWWATFFVYFGGSLGWLVTFIREKRFDGESMFWSQQSISTLINPPFALSFLLLIFALIFLIKYRDGRNITHFLLATLFFALIINIKIYSILGLGALFVAGIFDLVKNKKFELIKVFIVSLILAIMLFYPLNKSSTGLIVFKPFWFVETIMGLSDKFNWPRFYLAMMNYKWGKIWIKMIPAYLIAFVIFLLGNIGTRIIAAILAFKWLKSIKKLTYLEVFVISLILVGIIIPIFFIQAGTSWNTIQFFYYSLMFLGIMAGIYLGEWFENKPTIKTYIISGIILSITVITTLATLTYHYLPGRPPAKISNEELEALRYLSKQEKGTVLTYPFDKDAAKLAESNPPRPLYLYDETAYVAAYSNQSVFLEDLINLNITGYNWRERLSSINVFLKTEDIIEARSFLQNNHISYIYWIKGQGARLSGMQLGLKKIFENIEVDIYKVE